MSKVTKCNDIPFSEYSAAFGIFAEHAFVPCNAPCHCSRKCPLQCNMSARAQLCKTRDAQIMADNFHCFAPKYYLNNINVLKHFKVFSGFYDMGIM
jgi:hypothetical protein